MAETKKPIPPHITPWVLLAVFLIITAGVLVQSNYRQSQKADFLLAMQTAVNQQSRGQNAKMFVDYKPEYDYLASHEPILNFKLQPIPADAQKAQVISDHEAWCSELIYHYYHADEVLNDAGYGGIINAHWYRALIINYMAASSCAL